MWAGGSPRMSGKNFLILCVLVAGCATGSPVTMPEPAARSDAPVTTPAGHIVVARLVRYPDSEVCYVTNADGVCYSLAGTYYRFQEGHWFYARGLTGPWTHIEMKYVPTDLFRVRGRVPEE